MSRATLDGSIFPRITYRRDFSRVSFREAAAALLYFRGEFDLHDDVGIRDGDSAFCAAESFRWFDIGGFILLMPARFTFHYFISPLSISRLGLAKTC